MNVSLWLFMQTMFCSKSDKAWNIFHLLLNIFCKFHLLNERNERNHDSNVTKRKHGQIYDTTVHMYMTIRHGFTTYKEEKNSTRKNLRYVQKENDNFIQP